MAINGSALRAFSRMDFHSFVIQIGLSKRHWSLTPSFYDIFLVLVYNGTFEWESPKAKERRFPTADG